MLRKQMKHTNTHIRETGRERERERDAWPQGRAASLQGKVWNGCTSSSLPWYCIWITITPPLLTHTQWWFAWHHRAAHYTDCAFIYMRNSTNSLDCSPRERKKNNNKKTSAHWNAIHINVITQNTHTLHTHRKNEQYKSLRAGTFSLLLFFGLTHTCHTHTPAMVTLNNELSITNFQANLEHLL